MRFLDIYFLDQKLVLTWHWQGLHKYLIFQLMDLILTLTGDLADAFVSLSRMIDDLRGSLASVQAENKVSWFFNTSQISFDWFSTVMKAITTMNNCYTGHDSYLLEWERYISKVLINYEFFFQDLKENLDNLKDIQSQLEQNIPHVRSIISENILGWH